MNIQTLNLVSKTVSKSTVETIKEFVYANRSELSNDLKLFYSDVQGLILIQLTKSASRRMSMMQILEMAYNIDLYVLNSGAVSVETHFIPV